MMHLLSKRMYLLHIYLSMCMILDHLVMGHSIPISHLDWLCSTRVLGLYHHLMGFDKSCDRRELHEIFGNHDYEVIEHPIFDRYYHFLFSFGNLDNHYLGDLSMIHCKSTILGFLQSIMIQTMFFGFEEQYKSHMLLMAQLYLLPCNSEMMMLMIVYTLI